MKKFVVDVLRNGADDFESSEEVYEAVGEVLQEISGDKSEAEIRLYWFCNVHVSMYLSTVAGTFVRNC